MNQKKDLKNTLVSLDAITARNQKELNKLQGSVKQEDDLDQIMNQLGDINDFKGTPLSIQQERESREKMGRIGTAEEEDNDLDAILNAASKVITPTTPSSSTKWSSNPLQGSPSYSSAQKSSTYSRSMPKSTSSKNNFDLQTEKLFDPSYDEMETSAQNMAKELELDAIQYQLNKDFQD